MTGEGDVRRGTVLVVEDDEGLRRLIARRLAAAGVEVAEAATATACLALLDRSEPALLIVDYSLPDFSAPALLDRLAATGRTIPFLVATGQGNEQVAVEMMRRGARDYLVKDHRFLDRLPDVTLRQLDQIAAERQLAVAERAREQSDKRLQRLVENLGDQYFLYETDTAGRFTFASPSVKLVLGYEVGEFLHLYTDFLTDHPMNAEARRRTEASNRGEQQPPYLVEVRHRDGTPRRLEVQEVPVLDAAGVVGFVEGTARDVTRELELRETMRIQAAALEATSNSIAITDAAGELVWVNSAFCAASGYSREEVLGRNPRILRSGEQDAEFYRLMWATISSGQDWTGELVNRRKDGMSLREAMTISPIRDAQGGIAYYIGVKRDVTHERELERQLLQSQRMEAVGTLAGGVAHDFNNLLTVIGGYNEVALGFVPEGHPAREALEEIRAAAGRAGALTQQLLTFSRKQAVKPQVIDPNVLVSRMARMLRPLLGEDIELVCDLAENAPWIVADAGQMEQVIMNLAVNGRDAMPTGGRLTIRTRRSATGADWPDPPGVPSAELLLLEVSDSGRGMDPETLAHAFEPFFTTKEQGKGTGLGLATVHGIVEQAGGRIRLFSHPEEGTRCQLLFPTAPPDQIPSETRVTAPAPPISPGAGEQVLVVEDDRALLDLTCRFLRSFGYRVVAASDAAEALERMAELGDEIALVVSDVILPKISGPELVARIRAGRPKLPALFVSGYAADKLEGAGASLADVALLAKPFTRAEILAAVRLALDGERGEVK